MNTCEHVQCSDVVSSKRKKEENKKTVGAKVTYLKAPEPNEPQDI
jgi:hypothetical protein